MSLQPEMLKEVVAAAPKVFATGTIVTLADNLDIWIKVFGLIYIVAQVAFLAYRAYHFRKNKKDAE